MHGQGAQESTPQEGRRPPEEGDRPALAIRVLAALALLYGAVLVLQNVGILIYIADHVGEAPVTSDPDPLRLIWTFAVLKIALILVAAFGFLRWPAPVSAFAYAMALLYAFPLGPLIEGRLMSASPSGLEILVSLSALLSYVAAACAVLARMIGRPARSLPDATNFD